MTKEEAIHYIETLSSGITRRRPAGAEAKTAPIDNPGRARYLLSALGDPQKDLRIIHVCGSNGKGSVSAMLDMILRKAGYRVGLYSSPHLQDFCERIRVDGKMIPGDDLAACTERLAPAAEELPDSPGLFCFLTALALQYFKERSCDVVILEAGIGGALDSTNVTDKCALTIVSNIGLEHTDILGDTIRAIARDKSQLIKPNSPCAAYDSSPEALCAIRERCSAVGSPLSLTDFSSLQALSSSLTGQDFSYRGKEYHLALPGHYQIKNAALALTAVDCLRSSGLAIGDQAVLDGLEHVRWPARFELLSKDPVILLDGGHNPQCAEALVQALDETFCGRRVCFLIGMMRDKNYRETLALLAGHAARIYCVRAPGPRALEAEELANALAAEESPYPETLICDNPRHALALYRMENSQIPLIIFGSLYLAGEIRDIFSLIP